MISHPRPKHMLIFNAKEISSFIIFFLMLRIDCRNLLRFLKKEEKVGNPYLGCHTEQSYLQSRNMYVKVFANDITRKEALCQSNFSYRMNILLKNPYLFIIENLFLGT